MDPHTEQQTQKTEIIRPVQQALLNVISQDLGLVAKEDTREFKVIPRYTIDNSRTWARTDTNKEIPEIEIGGEVIKLIADLLRSEFKPENYCLNPPISPRDFFSMRQSLKLPYLSLLPENLRLYIASKGLPQEIGELVAIAVANRIARSLIQTSRELAEKIDEENIEARVKVLDSEIEQLTQEIPLLDKEIATAERSFDEKTKEIEDQRNNFNEQIKIVGDLFYYLTQGKPEETHSEINRLQRLLSNFQLLSEKRKLFTSQIETPQDFLKGLDVVISESFNLTEKQKSIFENFGIDPQNFLIESARKHLQSFTQLQPSEIFEFGCTLLRAYNLPISEKISGQIALFGRYEKSNPEQAKNIALSFASRMMILNLLTFGSEKSEQYVNNYWSKNTMLYASFFKYFHSILTENFNTTSSVEKIKKEINSRFDELTQEQKDLEGKRQKRVRVSLDLKNKQSEKEKLTFPLSRNSRIKEIIASYIKQTLGLPKDDNIVVGDLDNLRLYLSGIYRLPIFHNILKALFDSLPKFIPPPEEENLRRSVRDYYQNTLFRSLPETAFNEFFERYPDYLRPLVEALIPDHPNQETASRFIEQVLWRYSFNPKYHIAGEMKYEWPPFLSSIFFDLLSGKKILYFSDHNLTRIDLRPLLESGWNTDNPQTQEEFNELRATIMKSLRQNGLDPANTLLVSETILLANETDYEPIIKAESISGMPTPDLIRRLLYFKPDPKTGQNFQGIYAIESPSGLIHSRQTGLYK